MGLMVMGLIIMVINGIDGYGRGSWFIHGYA